MKKIKAPITDELKKFETYFKSSLKGDGKLLNIITQYILKQKGKKIRPIIVFLSAKLNGAVTNSTYIAATLIELLHTATLVHDDVVDETYERRGFFSINSLWNNKVAVLFGDYLLSKGLLLSINENEFSLLRIVSQAVKEVSEGELLQIQESRKLSIDEKIYFSIIYKKTASLIVACTQAGSESAGSDAKITEKMHQLGKHIGISFQIKDDIFDYQTSAKIGKPVGNDIKEKKLTLPLIYVLNRATTSDKRKILRTINRHNKNPGKVNELIDFVKQNGGIEYAMKIMNEHKNKALQILSEFEDSEVKQAFIALVNYITLREK